jgi:hypothetical protein
MVVFIDALTFKSANIQLHCFLEFATNVLASHLNYRVYHHIDPGDIESLWGGEYRGRYLETRDQD